ncbi:MAG: hypothetical protein ABSB15_01330 [Bryobacteraceae bacterium]
MTSRCNYLNAPFATSRRNVRSFSVRRPNPIRQMMAEKQLAREVAKSRERVQQLHAELPTIIHDRVGEQIQKLEDKLLTDFKEMGQRAIEESTAALNDHLNERIDTLEKVSALQSRTIVNLRDSSRIAEQKVSAVVNVMEKSLAGAVPGFKLDPPAYQLPAAAPALAHAQFQLAEPLTEMVRADSREISGLTSKLGFCPHCTSTNVRRAYRQGLFEELLRLFFVAPFRCRACRHKFYRF